MCASYNRCRIAYVLQKKCRQLLALCSSQTSKRVFAPAGPYWRHSHRTPFLPPTLDVLPQAVVNVLSFSE